MAITKTNTNLIAIGMLRPGFTDMKGRTSDGIEGESVGDNYDEPRVRQIAGSIAKLKKHYNTSKVILVGHSGGAAVSANLIGLHQGLVDHAFIVSCPCNINVWRDSMFKLTNKLVFKGNLKATSPVDLVASVSNKTLITVIVGEDDKVAPPSLSIEYEKALTKMHKNVTLSVIEGGHEIFLNSEVLNSVRKVISSYNKAIHPTSA